MTAPKKPDDLTRQRQKAQMAEVLRALERGCFLETAARSAGIAADTLTKWLARGRKESEGFYREFVDEVGRVDAKVEILVGAGLLAAAVHDPKWFAYWLERRGDPRWRLPKEPTKTGNDSGEEEDASLSWSALSVEDRRALLEILGRASSGKDTAKTG